MEWARTCVNFVFQKQCTLHSFHNSTDYAFRALWPPRRHGRFWYWGVLWSFPLWSFPWMVPMILKLHSHRSSNWDAVGIPRSGAAIPGWLAPMSTESLQVIGKGRSNGWKARVEKKTWETRETDSVRAWQSPFKPVVFMAQWWLVLREIFLLPEWRKIWSAYWKQNASVSWCIQCLLLMVVVRVFSFFSLSFPLTPFPFSILAVGGSQTNDFKCTK